MRSYIEVVWSGYSKPNICILCIKVIYRIELRWHRVISAQKSFCYFAYIIMPRCECASEVYSSVFVCLSVCVDCYSCSKTNQVQVRVSIGFLDFNSWICKIILRSLVLLTWNAIAAFSEECVAKLVHRVLLIYSVVSSALEAS